MPHPNGDITAAESFYAHRMPTQAERDAWERIVPAPEINPPGAWWREQGEAQRAKRLVIRDEDRKRSIPDLVQWN